MENNIPFNSSNTQTVTLLKKSILVFDIEPQKLSKYIQSVGFSAHAEYIYYNKSLFKKFFTDIVILSEKYGYQVYLKRKRILYDEEDSSYKEFIKSLLKYKCFNVLNPELDAEELIKNAYAIIGSPFTSVPFIAKNMNKESIYYDPLNYVFKNDRNRNGVDIISGYTDLSNWLEKN